jgi:hypothetical protein
MYNHASLLENMLTYKYGMHFALFLINATNATPRMAGLAAFTP